MKQPLSTKDCNQSMDHKFNSIKLKYTQKQSNITSYQSYNPHQGEGRSQHQSQFYSRPVETSSVYLSPFKSKYAYESGRDASGQNPADLKINQIKAKLKQYKSLPQQHFQKHENQRVLNRSGISNTKGSCISAANQEESPYKAPSIIVSSPQKQKMITPQKPKQQESPIRRYNFLKETSPAPLPRKVQLEKKQNERNSYKTLERQKNKKAIEDIQNILVSIKNTLGRKQK